MTELIYTRTILLSYSRVDWKFAQRLRSELIELGYNLWQDIHDIPLAADDWWRNIKEAIDQCETVVLCISVDALKSPIVSQEWTYARDTGKRVIPVIADELFKHPEIENKTIFLPNWIRRANWADFRPGARDRSVIQSRFLNELRSPYKPRRVHRTVHSTLPLNYVTRLSDFEPLLQSLITPSNDAIAITAGIRGAGGFGKTTLARALCQDLRVNGAFDDGVFWITLGERLLKLTDQALDNDLRERVLDLILEMTGTRPAVSTLEAAREELKRAIGDRYLLLVVDDVWHKVHLEPFLIAGKHNATLITTRDDAVLPPHAVRHKVDALAIGDAVSLLTSGIDERSVQPHEKDVNALARRLGRWAQALAIVNGVLLTQLAYPDATLSDAIKYVTDRLDEVGLDAFDPEDAAKREDAIGKTIELGIGLLSDEAAKRFRKLGVLPDDVSIPITTLALLWEQRPIDARDLCEKLARRSLVQNFDGKAIRIHDIMLTYLSQKMTGENQRSVHAHLVSMWPDTKRLPDTYAWRYFSYHLNGAMRISDLRPLLLDFNWLQEKLNFTDVASLLSDFAYFSEDEDLALVQSAIGLSFTILAAEKRQLAPQLAGRLRIYQRLQNIGALLENLIYPRGTFRTLGTNFPSYIQAGGALSRTMTGHTETVIGAIRLTSNRIISWSSDGTLRLWEDDGSSIRVLEEHDGMVEGVAELNNGYFICWSRDGRRSLFTSDGEFQCFFPRLASITGLIAFNDGAHIIWEADSNVLTQWSQNGTLVCVLENHSGVILGARSIHNHQLITWSSDGDVKLWDQNGRLIKTVVHHREEIGGVTLLDTGELLTWADSGEAQLCRLDGSTYKHGSTSLHIKLPVPRNVLDLGNRRILHWQGNTIRIWDLFEADNTDEKTNEIYRALKYHEVYEVQHMPQVKGVQILPNDQIVSWSKDWDVKLWGTDGTLSRSLAAHTSSINGTLPLSNARLLSWSHDRTLRIWETTKPTVHAPKAHETTVRGILDLSNNNLLSWCDDNSLRIWQRDGTLLHLFNGHSQRIAGASVLNNREWVTWGFDGELRIWKHDRSFIQLSPSHLSAVNGVMQTSTSRMLSWSDDGTIREWNLQTYSGHIVKDNLGPVRGIFRLTDDRLLLWSVNSQLQILTANGEFITSLTGHNKAVKGAIQLNDGQILSWAFDNELRLWDEEGKYIQSFNEHKNRVNGALQTEAGFIATWSADNQLFLRDLKGQILHSYNHTDAVMGTKEIRDRQLLSWSWDGTVKLWDFDGNLVATHYGDAPVVSCLFLSDVNIIVAGDNQGRLQFLEPIR